MPMVLVAHLPDGIAQSLYAAEPTSFATSIGPECVGLLRVPRRDVDAVGDMSDRDLHTGPAGEETLKQPAAYFSMEPADAVHRSAAADRQIGCIERRRVCECGRFAYRTTGGVTPIHAGVAPKCQ